MDMNEADNMEAQKPTTSRRVLLKGAVAAGVAGAVYAAPVVNSVPAYATHGLSSYTFTSPILCFGFSPNHQGERGDYHMLPSSAPAPANRYSDGGTLTKAAYPATVPGTAGSIAIHDPDSRSWVNKDTRNQVTMVWTINGKQRRVTVGGNIHSVVPGTRVASGVNNLNGGGMSVMLDDALCEIQFFAVSTKMLDDPTKCGGATDDLAAAPNKVSSTSPINGSASPSNAFDQWYQGNGNNWIAYYHSGTDKDKGDKIKGLRFRIRCND